MIFVKGVELGGEHCNDLSYFDFKQTISFDFFLYKQQPKLHWQDI